MNVFYKRAFDQTTCHLRFPAQSFVANSSQSPESGDTNHIKRKQGQISNTGRELYGSLTFKDQAGDWKFPAGSADGLNRRFSPVGHLDVGSGMERCSLH